MFISKHQEQKIATIRQEEKLQKSAITLAFELEQISKEEFERALHFLEWETNNIIEMYLTTCRCR